MWLLSLAGSRASRGVAAVPGSVTCLSWQVNHSPSFNTDSQLDHEVKDALLCDTFNLINVHACDRKKVLEEDKRRVKERLLQASQTPWESRYCCSPKCCRSQ